MIKNNVPYCEYCHREMQALTPRQALDDIRPHGWHNWRTAVCHVCFDCSDGQFDEWAKDVGFPACYECETYPCKRGRDCWDHRNPPNNEPYETYYADALSPAILIPNEEDDDEDEEDGPETEEDKELLLQVQRRQRMRLAGMDPKQLRLIIFLEAIE